MSLLLSLYLAAAGTGGLTLEIGSPQKTVLVGEPVKVVVNWRATTAVERVSIEEGDFVRQSLAFVVSDGSGTRLYRENPRQITERVLVPERLAANERRVTNLVLLAGGYAATNDLYRTVGGFLFPAKGAYSLKAVYVESGKLTGVESNAIRFVVNDPGPDDHEILEHIRREPRMLDANGSAETQALVKQLVHQHPQSPYLRWARLRLFEEKSQAPYRDIDPEIRQHMQRHDKPTLERLGIEQYQRITEDVLSGADWGPFEEEALALAIFAANAAGDREKAERARNELFEKHPDSATVKQMKAKDRRDAEADDDDNEPTIRPTKKPSPRPMR